MNLTIKCVCERCGNTATFRITQTNSYRCTCSCHLVAK